MKLELLRVKTVLPTPTRKVGFVVEGKHYKYNGHKNIFGNTLNPDSLYLKSYLKLLLHSFSKKNKVPMNLSL